MLADPPLHPDEKLRARAEQELTYHGIAYKAVRGVHLGRTAYGSTKRRVHMELERLDGEVIHVEFDGDAHPNVLLDQCIDAYSLSARNPATVARPYLTALDNGVTDLLDVVEWLEESGKTPLTERLRTIVKRLDAARRRKGT